MNKQITVALATDGIWPYVIGGMQKHSYYLCKALLNNNIKVVLIHTAAEITEEVKNCDCFTMEEHKTLSSIVVPQPRVAKFPGHYLYQAWLYSKLVTQEIQLLKGVDFIIAKGLTGWHFSTNRGVVKAPLAINIHGYEFMQRKADWKMRIESLMLGYPLRSINKKADYVFSYGGRITDYIRELGIPDEKIIVIPGGIEEEWMNDEIDLEVPLVRFLFVGRYERRKGILELNKALSQLTGRFPFTMSFIGPIPIEAQLNIPEVSYWGLVTGREALMAAFHQTDVLICPSYSEGMPNVIIEGMANSCAIIATDVGAVAELVNNQNGWLIDAANVDALKNAMISAINSDKKEMERKKEYSYKRVKENFIWPKVGNRLISEINKRII